MNGICLTCDTVQSFDDLLKSTKESMFTFLGQEFLFLLSGMMVFFIVWMMITSLVYGRGFQWAEFFEYLFTAFFVAACLSSGFFWWPIFDLIVQICTWMAMKVGTLGGLPEPTNTGLVGFVEQIEKILFAQVYQLIDFTMGELTLRNVGKSLLLLVAAIFFALLVWEMLKSVVRSYFAIQTVAILAAPLVFFYSMKDTREIPINGLKVVIVNGLRLFVGMAIAQVVLVTFQKLGTAAQIQENIASADLKAYFSLLISAAFMWLGYQTFMAVTGEIFQVFGQQQNLSARGLINSIVNKIKG